MKRKSRIRRHLDHPGVREFSNFINGLDREVEVKINADGVPEVSQRDASDSTWHFVRVTNSAKDIWDF